MEPVLLTKIGLTLHTLGEILVGFTAIRVHWRVFKKHKIDSTILNEMKNEQVIGSIGIACIIIGYILEVTTY